jgi:hypothetical protein
MSVVENSQHFDEEQGPDQDLHSSVVSDPDLHLSDADYPGRSYSIVIPKYRNSFALRIVSLLQNVVTPVTIAVMRIKI